MNERYEEIERETGLRLDASSRDSVPSLNAVPAEVVRALAALSRFDQHLVLRHLAGRGPQPYFDAFLDALERGEQPADWGTGGVLVPDLGLAALVASSVEDVLGPLGAVGGDPDWVVVDPDPAAWRGADASAGAPGRALPREVDYDWSAPGGTSRLLRPHRETRPAPDPRLATLRWMASRFARIAGGGSVEQAVRDAGADPAADALRAARVADRERAELGPPGEEVPGFRAPGDWFQG